MPRRSRRIAAALATSLGVFLCAPSVPSYSDGGGGGGGGAGTGGTTPSIPPPTVRTPGTPSPGGVKPPSTPTPGGSRTGGTGGPRGQTFQESPWRTWWAANADSLRPRRPDRSTSDAGLFRTGDAAPGARSDSGRNARRLVDRDVLPLLRETIASPHEDPDTVSAAVIAMGKVTADVVDVDRILAVLDLPTANTQVRRSAVVGLGVLRRSGPNEAFDGRLLDRVRARLFAAVDDEAESPAVRCFAAFSIGLLGDQPTNPDDAFARSCRLVVRDLWLRFEEHASRGDDLPVALLVALSLQPREAVPDAIVEGLRACAVNGRMAGKSVGSLAQAHAVLAFARLSDVPPFGLLLGLAKSRNHDLTLRRSAIVALTAVAPRLDGGLRAVAATGLLDVVRTGDPDTAGFALQTLGRLLAADFAVGSTAVLQHSEAVAALIGATDGSSAGLRPFAALALAIAARPTPTAEGLRPFVEFRERVAGLLREGVTNESRDADTRGAFATALGLLGDARATPILLGLTEGKGDPALRADACGALGLLGRATPEALATLRASVHESSDPRLRREAARALGFLGDVASVPALLPALEKAGDEYVRSRAAMALGAIGDPGTIPPLVALARSRGVTDALKSLLVSALGLVGDPEPVPSLTRLGVDSNYLARTAALHDAFGLF